MKILNLIIYSKNYQYDIMMSILRKYYNTFSNVTSVFIILDSTIQTEYLLENNILFIKGTESYIPGILYKTIKALHYFKDTLHSYNYVIRSNVSTIINFDLLTKLLNDNINNKIDYASGLLLTLNWLDPQGGINDNTYFGTTYASGTSIILSSETALKMIEMQDKFNYNVIDDVSIGLFIKDNLPDIQINSISDSFVFTDNINISDLKLIDNSKYIFYRNRSNDRNNDIQKMTIITNNLTGNSIENDEIIENKMEIINKIYLIIILIIIMLLIFCFVFNKINETS